MAIVAIMATVVSSFVANAVGPVRPLALPSLPPVVPPVLADTARYDGIDAQLAKLEEKIDGVASIASSLEAKIDGVEKKVDDNFHNLEPTLWFTLQWSVRNLRRDLRRHQRQIWVIDADLRRHQRQIWVIDAGRALTANKLCAIARETAFAFAGYFTAPLTIATLMNKYIQHTLGSARLLRSPSATHRAGKARS